MSNIRIKSVVARTLMATFLLVTAIGCTDELESAKTYRDGFLHFKFILDNDGVWKEDGTRANTTRLLAPIEMEQSLEGGMPLYLHCVENSGIKFDKPAPDTTAVTRGERITGEAFDPENQILTSFGLYVKRSDGEDSGLPIDNEIQRSELEANGEWYVKMVDLGFGENDENWTTQTVDFYGFAPFPGAGDGQAKCISVTEIEGTPIISFHMLENEVDNKDILTASSTDLTKADTDAGVELTFQHILSAIKFKLNDKESDPNNYLDNDNFLDFQYTLGKDGDDVSYNIKVKSIKLVGIYSSGMAILGTILNEDNCESYWTKNTDETIGDCTANIDRTTSQVENGGLINTDEHCFMVLPQATPEGAKAKFLCDLYDASDKGNTGEPAMTNVIFEATFPTGTSWKAGYSYTYIISKDNFIREYVLHSNVKTGESTFEASDGGLMEFPISGGTKEFKVQSEVMKRTISSSTTSHFPQNWHIEYQIEPTDPWTRGLPQGFILKKGTTSLNSTDSFEGSVDGEVFTLVAPERIELSDDYSELQRNHYPGEYDLSIHDIGFDNSSTTVARSTANCYIINGWGDFKLPLVYGNAIKKGLDNPIAYQYEWTTDKTSNGIDNDDADLPKDRHGVFVNALGNYISNPYINADVKEDISSNNVEILWSDEPDVIDKSSLIVETSPTEDIDNTDPEGDYSGYKQYLKFSIREENVRPANILLAVKNSQGTILWSWHIWVTPYDYNSIELTGNGHTMKVAPRTIGWYEPELLTDKNPRNIRIKVVQDSSAGESREHPVQQDGGAISVGGSNLIYQLGRKDPFPSATVTVKPNSAVFTGNTLTSIDYTLIDKFDECGITVWEGDTKEMNYMHQNPKEFQNYKTSDNPATSQNWFRTANVKNTWRFRQPYMCWLLQDAPADAGTSKPTKDVTKIYDDLSKTIYDPSPVGYVVPNYGLIYVLAGQTWEVEDRKLKTPIPYAVCNKGEPNELKLYYAGCRRQLIASQNDRDKDSVIVSSTHFGLTEFKESAYLHTAYTYNRGLNAGYIYIRKRVSSGGANPTYSISPSVRTGSSSPARFTSRGFSVLPVEDAYKDQVQSYTSSSTQNFKELDVTGVELERTTDNYIYHTDYAFLVPIYREYGEKWGVNNISSNTDFNRSVNMTGTTTPKTLKQIIDNEITGYTDGQPVYKYKKVKAYVSNVRVYYTYNGFVSPATGFTNSDIRLHIHPSYGEQPFFRVANTHESELGEKVGTNQYCLTFPADGSSIEQSQWRRLDLSSLNNWVDIIPIERMLNVSINKVVLDIRLSWAEDN